MRPFETAMAFEWRMPFAWRMRAEDAKGFS
jgi:hypothetical protein